MRLSILLAGCLLTAACSRTAPPPESSATLFEGARLITGDGSAPIENSAFLIENAKITAVGRKGDIMAPAGAARVDLTGKTVMPALVDTHTHLGWAIIKTGRIDKDTYTKDNLIDHLHRLAYYGVAATQSMGIDPGETPYEVRANPVPDAALFHTAGRGMGRPNAGPGQPYWKPVAYGIDTEADGRKAVQELADKKVDWVKIWVDDRNGTVPKLTPPLYRAIIDEAHKHDLRVVAHIYYLADAKELLRAGIDGFAHGVRDTDIDDEFMKLIKDRPNVFVIPNLPDIGTGLQDPAWLAETVPASEIKRLTDAFQNRSPADVKKANDFFAVQARNLKKLSDAGVRIGFGTDSGDHGRLDRPRGAGGHGHGRHDADSGDHGRNENLGRNPENGSARHGGSGQERRLHRAGRESAGQHHQFPEDRAGVSAREGSRPGGFEGGLCWSVTV